MAFYVVYGIQWLALGYCQGPGGHNPNQQAATQPSTVGYSDGVNLFPPLSKV
jgi:hypothetical protein